jgi:hypothetical protein
MVDLTNPLIHLPEYFDLKRRWMSSLLRIASENESAHDAGQ